MGQRGAIFEVVVAHLVSASFDLRNHVGVPDGPFTNQEEGCRCVVLPKNLQDFECETWVRAIVEGESHYGKIRPNAISNIRTESLYYAQDTERLHPVDHKPHPQKSGGNQQDSQHLLPQSRPRAPDRL